MPAKVSKSNLLTKLGPQLKKAHEQHKMDETEYSQFGELPPGIENGIAQLVDIKFDQYKAGDNQGEFYFYAAGVVVSPEEAETFSSQGDSMGMMKVRGLRTSIMEALCPTPKSTARTTVDDHLKWVYNELRKLGVDTSTMEFEDLEPTVEALKESQPYFRFRTWRGKPTTQYPNPRTNHNWNGVCEPPDVSELPAATETEDDSEAARDEDETPEPAVNGRGKGHSAAPAAGPTNRMKGVAGTPPKSPTAAPTSPTKAAPTRAPAKASNGPAKAPGKGVATASAAPAKGGKAPPTKGKAQKADEEFSEFGDLDSLAAVADSNDDEEAKAQLTEFAIQAGFSETDVDDADNWAQVVQMILGQRATDTDEAEDETVAEDTEEAETEEDAPREPAADEVYFYAPIDPKTKKPRIHAKTKKPIKVECTVTAVNKKKQTVDLHSLDETEEFKAVPWASLQEL